MARHEHSAPLGGERSSMAAAIPSRWFIPSEKPPVRRRPASESPTSSRTWSTRLDGMWLLFASQRRWLRARLPGCVAPASRSAPTSRRGARRSRYRLPPTRTSPASGASSPRIRRIVVDFPAPFGPTNPVTRPVATPKDSPSTATVRPYRFVRPCASIAALMLEHGRTEIPRCRRAPEPSFATLDAVTQSLVVTLARDEPSPEPRRRGSGVGRRQWIP